MFSGMCKCFGKVLVILCAISNIEGHILSKRQIENILTNQSVPIEVTTQSSNGNTPNIYSVEPLTGSHLTTVKILMYISAGWIVAWCMLCSVVNIIFNEFSMQRFLEVYQEFGFAVLFVFMGSFIYQNDTKGLCITTQIIILFFVNFVMSIFFVKIFLGACLIRNVIDHLTSFHWFLGFALPFLEATIATIVGYFSCSDYFGLQITHCFSYTRTKQLWAFTTPIWIIFICLNLMNLYAFTMCKLTRLEDADLSQLYWSFKTCKVTSFLFLFTSTAYFSLMFAADMQLVWLHCVYFVCALLLGPIIFISHTFTHAQTCISLFALTSLCFYKPCPPPMATKQEEQFGVMFSLRMKIPSTNAPPNTAEELHPNAIQYSENIMEQMLVIETPPLLRAKKPKRYLNDNQNIQNARPPPIFEWS